VAQKYQQSNGADSLSSSKEAIAFKQIFKKKEQ
jgi:hypothetical protein